MRRLKNFEIAPFVFLLVLFFLVANFQGCKGKNTGANAAPPPPPMVVKSNKIEEPVKEIPVYVYKADRLRDPFSPVGFATSYQPDAVFDPQRATVKAIIFGTETRTAAVSVGGGGTYFIKAGRIFDIMGKTIEGFKAQVLVNKVVVQSDSGEMFELKIRETEEGKS